MFILHTIGLGRSLFTGKGGCRYGGHKILFTLMGVINSYPPLMGGGGRGSQNPFVEEMF